VDKQNFGVSMNGKDLCLIFSGSIAVSEEHNIARQQYSRHKQKYKNCVNALRRQKVAALKRRQESEQDVFRRCSNNNSTVL
jgi:hypothetical protein